ncbi:MAG: Mor transcription activator family protein [Pseudomonadota bacterium]|nr:Mor transcription activator family protein [Pseudomonadota bacterium]
MSHSHQLQHVVDLIGAQSAIRLVRAKGGQCVSFCKPESLHDKHWLAVLVGLDHARQLCIEFDGKPLKLPIEVNALLQLRNEAIAAEFQDGVSVSQLARDYEIDRKLVQRILDRYGLRGTDVEPDVQLGLGV